MGDWTDQITIGKLEAFVSISYQERGRTPGDWDGFFIDPSPELQDLIQSANVISGPPERRLFDTSIGPIIIGLKEDKIVFKGAGNLNLPKVE
jgi:hypothetical protein